MATAGNRLEDRLRTGGGARVRDPHPEPKRIESYDQTIAETMLRLNLGRSAVYKLDAAFQAAIPKLPRSFLGNESAVAAPASWTQSEKI